MKKLKYNKKKITIMNWTKWGFLSLILIFLTILFFKLDNYYHESSAILFAGLFSILMFISLFITYNKYRKNEEQIAKNNKFIKWLYKIDIFTILLKHPLICGLLLLIVSYYTFFWGYISTPIFFGTLGIFFIFSYIFEKFTKREMKEKEITLALIIILIILIIIRTILLFGN